MFNLLTHIDDIDLNFNVSLFSVERYFPLFSKFPIFLKPTKPLPQLIPSYPLFPFPTFPPIPTTSSSSVSGNQTCICVPIGTCSSSNGTSDGSGLLDLRIVS